MHRIRGGRTYIRPEKAGPVLAPPQIIGAMVLVGLRVVPLHVGTHFRKSNGVPPRVTDGNSEVDLGLPSGELFLRNETPNRISSRGSINFLDQTDPNSFCESSWGRDTQLPPRKE